MEDNRASLSFRFNLLPCSRRSSQQQNISQASQLGIQKKNYRNMGFSNMLLLFSVKDLVLQTKSCHIGKLVDPQKWRATKILDS